MKKKPKNQFDMLVEMFSGADCIFLSFYDKKSGSVIGEPYDSKTGALWSMSLISTIEDAISSKYPVCCSSQDKDLIEFLEENRNVTDASQRIYDIIDL